MTEIIEQITPVDVDTSVDQIVVQAVESSEVIVIDGGEVIVQTTSSNAIITTTSSQVQVQALSTQFEVILELSGVTDHASLSGIGINTHDEIDDFIANALNVDKSVSVVTSVNQTAFTIPAKAIALISFNINQWDYIQKAVLAPAGSGNVTYTPDFYPTEIGDVIVTVFTFAP